MAVNGAWRVRPDGPNRDECGPRRRATHTAFLSVGFSVQDESNTAHEEWQNASQSRPFALRAPRSHAKPLSLIQIIFCLMRLMRLPCLILGCYSSVHNLSGECSVAVLGVSAGRMPALPGGTRWKRKSSNSSRPRPEGSAAIESAITDERTEYLTRKQKVTKKA